MWFYHQTALSTKVYPENTLSNFTTHIPGEIKVEPSKWQVALQEISFRHSWYNIREGYNALYKVYYLLWDKEIERLKELNKSNPDCLMYDENDPRQITKRIEIPFGNYKNIRQLIDKLNEWEKEDPRPIRFKVDKLTGKAEIKFFPQCGLLMNGSDIAIRLGFDKELRHYTRNNSETIKSNTIATLNRLDNVYVYTDIVENQHVGDFKVPLLRVVPVKSKFNEINWIHYDKPHYLRLSRENISNIEINIRDETGEVVPFVSGKVIVTLVFQRIATRFYD